MCQCGSEQGFLKLWKTRDVSSVIVARILKKLRGRDHSMELELGLSIVFPKDIAILNSVIYFCFFLCSSC